MIVLIFFSSRTLIFFQSVCFASSFSSVAISLEASEVCDVVLLVSYVVSNASWSSSYDVRVFTKDKTMKVIVCMHSMSVVRL